MTKSGNPGTLFHNFVSAVNLRIQFNYGRFFDPLLFNAKDKSTASQRGGRNVGGERAFGATTLVALTAGIHQTKGEMGYTTLGNLVKRSSFPSLASSSRVTKSSAPHCLPRKQRRSKVGKGHHSLGWDWPEEPSPGRDNLRKKNKCGQKSGM